MDIKHLKEIYGDSVEIRELHNIEIMTPSGFKPVKYIKRSKASSYYRLILSNGDILEASSSHKIMGKDGHFYYINMVSPGFELANDLTVSSVEEVLEETYLYDFLDVEGNIYLTTNGIVNHNCAFIDNIETTMTAALPTLSTGGQVMLLSTPNGIGNFFHKTWVKAEMGENSFVPVRLPWQVHPERDQSWRDQQDADMGKRQAAQECVTSTSRILLQDPVSGQVTNMTIGEAYETLMSD